MTFNPLAGEILIWFSILFCISQSAIFSGLNLAVFSLSRLRLEVAADNGNVDAANVRDLRRDSHLTLSTIIWANVLNNVLLTLLSKSLLTGLGAFVFSVFAITILGEIVPQAYFSRHALRVTVRLLPLLKIYRFILFPVAKPTAVVLNWWLGYDGIKPLREQDVKALISRQIEIEGSDMGTLEGMGALNFLDLDDVSVANEGELIDPRSIIRLPIENGRPLLPQSASSPDDPFLRQLNASGHTWVVITDLAGQPRFVLNADHYLRDILFRTMRTNQEVYWHRPIIVNDMHTRLGEVVQRLTVNQEHPEDDVIDNDLILIWGEQKRIITGADLLGRLLRGIATIEPAAIAP